METTLMLSFVLCVLALLANPLLVAPKAVLDVDGDELKAGGEYKYYVVSGILGPGGGGLTLGKNRNGSICPLDVVQEWSDLNWGLPVTFSSVDPKNEEIQLGTDLNIKFSTSLTTCSSIDVWKVDTDQFVTTGGVIGNPGCVTLSNWFRILKVNSQLPFYKLVFCPSVCEDVSIECRDDFGIINNNGARRLTTSNINNPFKLVFIKSEGSTTSSFSHNSRIMSVANN